eukprot:jgi/Mesvir1/1581/Mv14550-RA.1
MRRRISSLAACSSNLWRVERPCLVSLISGTRDSGVDVNCTSRSLPVPHAQTHFFHSTPAPSAAAGPEPAAASKSEPPTLHSQLRRLYRLVHPDLFHNDPDRREVNQNSFQLLQQYLSALKEPARLGGFSGHVHHQQPCKLVFHVRQGNKPGAEGQTAQSDDFVVSVTLPPSSAKHASTPTRFWPTSSGPEASVTVRGAFGELFSKVGLPAEFTFGELQGPLDDTLFDSEFDSGAGLEELLTHLTRSATAIMQMEMDPARVAQRRGRLGLQSGLTSAHVAIRMRRGVVARFSPGVLAHVAPHATQRKQLLDALHTALEHAPHAQLEGCTVLIGDRYAVHAERAHVELLARDGGIMPANDDSSAHEAGTGASTDGLGHAQHGHADTRHGHGHSHLHEASKQQQHHPEQQPHPQQHPQHLPFSRWAHYLQHTDLRPIYAHLHRVRELRALENAVASHLQVSLVSSLQGVPWQAPEADEFVDARRPEGAGGGMGGGGGGSSSFGTSRGHGAGGRGTGPGGFSAGGNGGSNPLEWTLYGHDEYCHFLEALAWVSRKHGPIAEGRCRDVPLVVVRSADSMGGEGGAAPRQGPGGSKQSGWTSAGGSGGKESARAEAGQKSASQGPDAGSHGSRGDADGLPLRSSGSGGQGEWEGTTPMHLGYFVRRSDGAIVVPLEASPADVLAFATEVADEAAYRADARKERKRAVKALHRRVVEMLGLKQLLWDASIIGENQLQRCFAQLLLHSSRLRGITRGTKLCISDAFRPPTWSEGEPVMHIKWNFHLHNLHASS